MVAAAIRTVFAQPDAEHVRKQLDTIAHAGTSTAQVEPCCAGPPRTSPLSPMSLCRIGKRDWEHHPLGRLNKEIKGRTDVVGVFPAANPTGTWEPARAAPGALDVRSGPPLGRLLIGVLASA